MNIEYLIKGMLIGFSVAAPVGPIGVLTINRTLTQGRIQGFATGMGATLADTVYGVIAGFGLTIVSSFLMEQEFLLKLIGGFFFSVFRSKVFTLKTCKRRSKS